MAAEAGWVLLLAQLPASPSSPRVALWRRLRAAGATGLPGGAWVLPMTEEHAVLFEQLAGTVTGQGGSGLVLTASAPAAEGEAVIVARFRADRAREYDEFAERCGALVAEVGKETGLGKFTFAELEEIEQDLEKLAGWLGKIRARDFFPDARQAQAAGALRECRQAVDGFARTVYQAEGLDPGDAGAAGPADEDG